MNNLEEKITHLVTGLQELDEKDQSYMETLTETLAAIPLPADHTGTQKPPLKHDGKQ
jgi:hypothetical protein